MQDLGTEPLSSAERELLVRDLGNPPGTLVCALPAGSVPNKRACLDALETDLTPGARLLLTLAGTPTDTELAAWRNVLWPLAHVFALYRCSKTDTVRQTLSGTERIAPGATFHGVVLAASRRADVLDPETTTKKFDQNAAGWDGGDPSGPGYGHFRWMRRFVGTFADARPGARILDFGSGAGWVGIEATKATPSASLALFDPSPELVRIALENARGAGLEGCAGRTGFGEAPPFPAHGEEPFDLVISSGVISFSPDHDRWLDGLTGTVAPAGRLVIGDLNPHSLGMRRRRRRRPLLPTREMNARAREEVRAALEARGFRHLKSAGYQLTSPVPQAMHVSETRLGGALSWPLLAANRVAAHGLGGSLASAFDSWVMSFDRAG